MSWKSSGFMRYVCILARMNMTPAVRALVICILIAAADAAALVAGYQVGGDFLAFWSAAFPWVLLGTGILALTVYMTEGEAEAE